MPSTSTQTARVTLPAPSVWRRYSRLWIAIGVIVIGGSFVPWLLMLFTGGYVAAHINQGKGDAAYLGMQAGIAIVIGMVQGQGPSSDVTPALSRLVGVLGGVLVVSICQPLVAPVVGWVIRPRA